MELMDLHASVGNGKSGRCASSSAINHLQTTAPASAPIKKKTFFGNQFAIERFFTPEKATTQKYEINFHEWSFLDRSFSGISVFLLLEIR